MSWIDWILVIVPIGIVLFIGYKSKKYVRGVVDFLSAGRVAGRYVISVSDGVAATGLISIVGYMESTSNSGFALSFWGQLNTLLLLLFSLTGYCTYRFRETRAMTIGQFLEMRYSRKLRIFAAVLQTISGVLNYAIFPAVSARFLIYFMGLPPWFTIGSWQIPTMAPVMAVCLGLALYICVMGGQVTVMVTDCMQGLLSYPLYVIIAFFILWYFSWNNEVIPTLINRAPGQSFINPFDISELRDFNIAYVVIGLISTVLVRMCWSASQGYFGAARTPHEQKMAGLLGSWRGGLSSMMFMFLVLGAYVLLNCQGGRFTDRAKAVRVELAQKTLVDIAPDEKFAEARADLNQAYHEIPKDFEGKLSSKHNQELRYQEVTYERMQSIEGGKAKAGTFNTIYKQMLCPMALRELFPIGLTGLFCSLMIFLMVTTDTTYMHGWGGVIAQDLILPIYNRPLKPAQQLRLLRWCIAFVAVFSFVFSLMFNQVDYVFMFFQITGAIWLGGAGPVMVFGLYSRIGTAAGAFASLIGGSVIAVSGIIMQQNWAEHLYPFLVRHDLADKVGQVLHTLSAPLSPYIVWEMNPVKFPINSMELMFIALMCSLVLYFGVSFLTCKTPFNLEKMLHRGEYGDGSSPEPQKFSWSLSSILSKLLSIDSNYTKGDKAIAWSVFLYSFGYNFCLVFVGTVIWNSISPWPIEWWSRYFLIINVIIPTIIGIITTIWFTVGGTMDLIRLFKDLAVKEQDDSDDGRVTHDDT